MTKRRFNVFAQSFKNELAANHGIESIALASNSIEGSMNSNDVKNWYWNGMDTSSQAAVSHLAGEPALKEIFNLKLKEGRWFNSNNSDKKNYVLNETAVKDLGIPQPVIGQIFGRVGGDTGQIIGVLKDYNFNSLYNKIEPLVISGTDDDLKISLFVKIRPGDVPTAMDALNATWKKFIPDAPFAYQFMNQAFDNLYKDDLKISKLVLLFSCISVTISALGLFGLAAFVAEQKRKEIGIRKVLGATVGQITTMLSKDFVLLVLIAIVVASPIAYWLMNKWLQNFHVSNHIKPVVVPCCRCCCFVDCGVNGKLSIHPGSGGKPREKFANRIGLTKHSTMLKNYFIIAVRHLFRHKFFRPSTFCALPLVSRFSCSLVCMQLNQYGVNASLKNVDRQYIVKSNWKVKEMGLDITTFGPLPKTLKEEYPDLVANYYRYNPVTNVVSAGDKHFKEDIAIGDTSFVSVYGFDVLYGDKLHPFADNNSAVITETMAKKLFGKSDAVNQILSILTTHDGEKQDYNVSAVLKDIPFNSVTNIIGDAYNVFVLTEGNRYYTGGDPSQGWAAAFEVGMVELKPGISPKDLEGPLKQILKIYHSRCAEKPDRRIGAGSGLLPE